MNIHHLWWNQNKRAARADTLQQMEDNDYTLLHEPDLPTYYCRSSLITSVLNLVFSSPAILNNTINWAIDEDSYTSSDHEMIRFDLLYNSLEIVPTPLAQHFNWKKTDWEKFNKFVEEYEKASS
jgi:hypothetical protein